MKSAVRHRIAVTLLAALTAGQAWAGTKNEAAPGVSSTAAISTSADTAAASAAPGTQDTAAQPPVSQDTATQPPAASALPQGQSPYGPQSGVPPLPKEEKPEKLPKKGKTQTSMRPFSHVGVAIKVGVDGAGMDVAVPLLQRLNLRGEATVLPFNHTFSSDGTQYHANLRLLTSNLAVDWFPFGGAFRLSPLVQIYNGNTVRANAYVAPGQSFSLNDVDYYSSAGSPIAGATTITLGDQGGSKVAPGFSLGFGNIIPRGRGHWSVPFEAGFVYMQAPTIQLNLSGISCQTQAEANAQVTTVPTVTGCAYIATDPTAQMNVQQQQTKLTNDLSPLRFFPILSVGLSYKF